MIAEEFLMGLVRGKRLALCTTLHGFFRKNRGFIHSASLSAPVAAAAWQLFHGSVPYAAFSPKPEVKPAYRCQWEVAVAASQHPFPDLAPRLLASTECEQPPVSLHVPAPFGAGLATV